jgi:hypothetical protein
MRVHAMRVDARTFAHVCVRTFLEVFAHKFVKTSLCVCYMLFTCAPACAQYARACTARMCALTHYWTDSLQNWWRHTWGHRNVHGIIDFYVRACVCTHIHACVRSHIFGRIRSIMYVRTCVCTLCACVHCTHVRAHTLLDGFSPKLMETYLGSQKRARHNWFVCARLSVHAMRVGARTCAHVCVRTFVDVLAPKLVKTSLSVGYMHFMCALACAHYARTTRVRALHA